MNSTAAKNRLREFVPGNWTDFDSLVQQLLNPQGLVRPSGETTPASVWEDDTAFHVEVDVPGIARDAIELTFEKGVLVVKTERVLASEERTNLVDERHYGKTTRKVQLPETADPESIEAEVTSGVLHVTVSKKPQSQPRRIEIKGAE